MGNAYELQFILIRILIEDGELARGWSGWLAAVCIAVLDSVDGAPIMSASGPSPWAVDGKIGQAWSLIRDGDHGSSPGAYLSGALPLRAKRRSK